MRDFLAALSFFTFIPAPGRRASPELSGWALAWAPLMGLLIGGSLAAINVGLRLTGWRGELVAALTLAAWMLLSGGTHLDGLADSLDGLLAWTTPQRRLEILRDVHVGTFAVVGLAMALLVKWAALLELVERGAAPLILGPVVARFGMLLVVRAFPYARTDGLGAGLREKLAAGPLIAAALTTLIVAGGVGMIWGMRLAVAVTLAGVAFALLFGLYANARLGGVTGDVYGATVELSEIVCLLAAALI